MKVLEILNAFEEAASFSFQEPYDNSGLQIGDHEAEVKGILLSVDITHEVLEEAIRKELNLIISHHPLIFNGLKSISEKTSLESIIRKAIRADVNIISVHTNIDNIYGGVNSKICEKLGLLDTRVLLPAEDKLLKLAVFIPRAHVEKVRDSIFSAGAGVIGEYDSCSFNTDGKGSFRGSETSNPFTGEKGKLHFEEEVKLETVLPVHLKEKVIKAMLAAHPYEEVAFDLYPLSNTYSRAGAGMSGKLPAPLSQENFLKLLKDSFHSRCIRYTRFKGREIQNIAVCGGSGSFLLKNAIKSGADAFVSADFKYHQFFEAEGKLLLADIGHFESEQFTKDFFYDLLNKKIPTFALHLSEVNTNPINYF